ncbi:RmlD-like substrate binding domain [Phytophthora cactorum]|nr:RmlD-like substrate binding domain [Phytophthora cactorum]
MAVLVLGGTSYVAHACNRTKLSEWWQGAVEEMEAVACTIRSQPFAPLPPGFVTAKSEFALQSKRTVRVYWQVDVLDLEALDNCIKDFRPTVIINCTAISSPAVCQKEPEIARAVNEPRGLVALLDDLPWQVRLVHLSTDFVYEGTQPLGASYDEDDAVLSSDLSASYALTISCKSATVRQLASADSSHCERRRTGSSFAPGQKCTEVHGVASPSIIPARECRCAPEIVE